MLNYGANKFSSQAQTTTILCDIQRTGKTNIPQVNMYTTPGQTKDAYATASGVALDGVMIFNGLALGNVDAVMNEAKGMDNCLEHSSP